MDEETYRYELRNHFMGRMKNSKLHHTAQHYKEHALRNQEKLHDMEPGYQSQRPSTRQPQSSAGGDADRAIYDYASQNGSSDTYRRNESSYIRQLHTGSKNKQQQQQQQNSNMPVSASGVHKYHPPAEAESSAYMYETDSNLGGIGGGGSEESGKSQKSSKTVVSKKSSHDLRKLVKSQCKLHEVIDETLKQMCNTECAEPTSEEAVVERRQHHAPPSESLQPQQKLAPMAMTARCKRCTGNTRGAHSRSRDVMTEIAKGDFTNRNSNGALSISVDDVVHSKVVNPIIRKVQRMYLNNLKEEMSLMEDIERLPHQVNEVYKNALLKQAE